MKKVLVTGANGAQSGAVINQLLMKGYAVRALSNSGKNAEQFYTRGVEIAIGHYGNVNSLKKALSGIDYVFLSFPVQVDEAVAINYCKAFIEAFKESSVKLVVYNTSAWYPDKLGGIVLHDIRIHMEAIFREAQLPIIILRPTLYLNNFLGPWSLPSILEEGTIAYPVKAHQKIAWTSHEALAAFTVKALENRNLAGQRYDIGNYLLTGEEIAQKFSIYLNKHVHFKFIDPADFEQQLALNAGNSLAREVANSYRYILENPEHFQQVCTPQTLNQLPAKIETVDDWLYRHLPVLA